MFKKTEFKEQNMSISTCFVETTRQFTKRKSDIPILKSGAESIKPQVVKFLETEKNNPEFRIYVSLPSVLRKLKGIKVDGTIPDTPSSLCGHVFSSIVDKNGKEHFFGFESKASSQRQKRESVKIKDFLKGVLGHKMQGQISTTPCYFHYCKKTPITDYKAERLIHWGNEYQNNMQKAPDKKSYQLLKENCVIFALKLANKIDNSILPPKTKIISPIGLAVELKKNAPKKLSLEI